MVVLADIGVGQLMWGGRTPRAGRSADSSGTRRCRLHHPRPRTAPPGPEPSASARSSTHLDRTRARRGRPTDSIDPQLLTCLEQGHVARLYGSTRWEVPLPGMIPPCSLVRPPATPDLQIAERAYVSAAWGRALIDMAAEISTTLETGATARGLILAPGHRAVAHVRNPESGRGLGAKSLVSYSCASGALSGEDGGGGS